MLNPQYLPENQGPLRSRRSIEQVYPYPGQNERKSGSMNSLPPSMPELDFKSPKSREFYQIEAPHFRKHSYAGFISPQAGTMPHALTGNKPLFTSSNKTRTIIEPSNAYQEVQSWKKGYQNNVLMQNGFNLVAANPSLMGVKENKSDSQNETPPKDFAIKVKKPDGSQSIRHKSLFQAELRHIITDQLGGSKNNVPDILDQIHSSTHESQDASEGSDQKAQDQVQAQIKPQRDRKRYRTLKEKDPFSKDDLFLFSPERPPRIKTQVIGKAPAGRIQALPSRQSTIKEESPNGVLNQLDFFSRHYPTHQNLDYGRTKVKKGKKQEASLNTSIELLNAKGRLVALSWMMVLPRLLKREARKKFRARQATAITDFRNSYGGIVNALCYYFFSTLRPELEQIFKGKTSYCIVQGEESGLFGKKTFSKETLDERVNIGINPYLRNIFNKLLSNQAGMKLPRYILKFLCSISENGCVPLPDFYTGFELKRLRFSTIGSLKHLQPEHSKMVIAIFMLGRILVYYILLNQATYGPKPDTKNRKAQRNAKVIASIISIVIEDIVKSTVPFAYKHQSAELHALPALKEGRLVAIDPYKKNTAPKEETQHVEHFIEGVYTKEDLEYYFTYRKDDVVRIRTFVQVWVDQIYAITHEYYLQNKKECLNR